MVALASTFFSKIIERDDSPASKPLTKPRFELQFEPTKTLPWLHADTTSLSSQSSGCGIPESTLDEAGLVMISELGQGNQSTVHLVRKLATEADRGVHCVKRVAKSPNGNEAAFVEREYDTMRKASGHPNILEAFNLFQDASFFYIEMPYCEGGDLTALKAQAIASGICPTEAWWDKVFKSCLEALAHLHSKDIIHCDVKEANLMVRTVNYIEPAIVLADFGISQLRNETREKTPTIIYGTPGYIPPEVWESKIWRPEGDMFSLGVVIAQMLMDRRDGIFVEGTESLKQVKQVTLTREPPFDLIHQPRLRKLVMMLLEKDPANRPTAVQALSNKWFDAIADSSADGARDVDFVSTDEGSDRSDEDLATSDEEHMLTSRSEMSLSPVRRSLARSALVPSTGSPCTPRRASAACLVSPAQPVTMRSTYSNIRRFSSQASFLSHDDGNRLAGRSARFARVDLSTCSGGAVFTSNRSGWASVPQSCPSFILRKSTR
jgi:serine/threonine protein kinase